MKYLDNFMSIPGPQILPKWTIYYLPARLTSLEQFQIFLWVLLLKWSNLGQLFWKDNKMAVRGPFYWFWVFFETHVISYTIFNVICDFQLVPSSRKEVIPKKPFLANFEGGALFVHLFWQCPYTEPQFTKLQEIEFIVFSIMRGIKNDFMESAILIRRLWRQVPPSLIL